MEDGKTEVFAMRFWKKQFLDLRANHQRMEKKSKIYCPKCSWVPSAGDLWQCLPSCGCLWNTFETAGTCPNCGHHWEETACPRCKEWSPHICWYHESKPDDKEAELAISA